MIQLEQKDIQLFPIDNKTTLFFHVETLHIYPLENDNEVLQFLKYYKIGGAGEAKKHYNDEDYKQIYDFICNKIAEVSTFHPQYTPPKEPVFDTVILPIAGHCNLNCPYCFAQTDGGFHFKDYTEKDINNVIDFIVSKNNKEEDRIYIVFFGGEPLLKMDIIRYTLQYAKDKYPKRKFQYSITTNGTLLKDDILCYLKENNISIMLSVDGPDNEFNLRRYRNGEKSIHEVIRNIKESKDLIDTELRATFVNTNPYMVETFDFFEHLEIPFTVAFAYSSENKSHHYADYDKNTLIDIRQRFDNLFTYYQQKIDKHEPIYNKLISKLSQTFRFREISPVSCASGNTFFTITADGTIYSCAHFMNNKSYSMGTISEGVDLEKREQYVPMPVEQIPECQDCWIKYLCVGGCTAQKITSGKRNNQSLGENECELQRIVWEFYLKLYYYIMTYAPSYLIKEDKEQKEVVC